MSPTRLGVVVVGCALALGIGQHAISDADADACGGVFALSQSRVDAIRWQFSPPLLVDDAWRMAADVTRAEIASGHDPGSLDAHRAVQNFHAILAKGAGAVEAMRSIPIAGAEREGHVDCRR